jgi:hypothetical protein
MMKNFLRKLFRHQSPAKSRSEALRVRPQLECLEERRVMTVTYHGGAVLPNVAVQGVYYGSDWGNDPTLSNQAGALDGYLGNVVNSPYMDMLNNAGYGVGRGHADQGKIVMANLNIGQYLTDTQIRNQLVSQLNSPTSGFQPPDANRLYVVYVEPNIPVLKDTINPNTNSFVDFHGYHDSFTANVGGTNQNIRYAVIAYPGGATGKILWLSTFDQLTMNTSHEIAEAVTDPDWRSKQAWTDDTWVDAKGNKGGEIGDICDGQTVYVNGYAVQRIVDKNDQAMTPANATAAQAVSFVLGARGMLGSNLYRGDGRGNLVQIATGVSSISDQGIDNQGRAMIDVISTNGDTAEYHSPTATAGADWTDLQPPSAWPRVSKVSDAKAGQGESFVLTQDGQLWEYKDADGSWWYLDSNVKAIDAGTDNYGVNAVTEIRGNQAWYWSDSTGFNQIAGGNVAQVSTGRGGVVDLVFTDGTAEWWHAYGGGAQGGQTASLGSNVSQVTTGYDANGNYIIDMLYTDGFVAEYHTDIGWVNMATNIGYLGKSRAGVVDMVTRGNPRWGIPGDAWEFYGPGTLNSMLLMSSAVQAA